MTVTIPGALADHLTNQPIADPETVAVLDAAHRSRGRTLVIDPTSTNVLRVISAYAEAILENRTLHTTAETRAARLWIQRAGHVPAPAAEQAPAAPTNAFEQGAAGQLADRVDLAETVICPTCRVAAGARCITRAGKSARETHGRRVEALEQAAGITQHRATARREAQARGYTSHGLDHTAEAALLTAYAARANGRAAAETMICVHGEDCPQDPRGNDHYQRPAVSRAPHPIETYYTLYCGTHGDHYPCSTPTRRHEYMHCVVGWADRASIHAGDVPPWCNSTAADRAAAAEEARHAAELITEAEATAGTWRGEWIGARDTDPALFALPAADQGALFA